MVSLAYLRDLSHSELAGQLNLPLGTLRGGARRRFETLARENPTVRSAALVWQSRIGSLNELQPAITPAPGVWRRIDNLLAAERDVHGMQKLRTKADSSGTGGVRGWFDRLGFWRGAAAAGATAAVLAVVGLVQMRSQFVGEIGALQAQLLATPQIEYVAVLADDKAAASVLVTFDPKTKQLTLQRVGAFREPGDKSLQLWVLTGTGGVRSLGVLGSERLLKLTAAETQVRGAPALAISLEPQGGVTGASGPTGPVLFKGALIQKQL